MIKIVDDSLLSEENGIRTGEFKANQSMITNNRSYHEKRIHFL